MNKLIFIQNIKDIIKIGYSDEINDLCNKYLKNVNILYEDDIIKNFNKLKFEICNLLDKSLDKEYSKKEINNKISYDEEWALKNNNYCDIIPTKEQLQERKDMIKYIYNIYYDYVKINYTILHPDEWCYPPQYCYEEQLRNNLEEYEEEFKHDKKELISKIKSIVNKEYKNTSIEDDLYMDHFY